MPGDSDPARREPTASPIEEARRLFAAAEDPDSRRDRGRHADRLKGFLAYVEGHRDGLSRDSPEVAKCLDETGVAFYQMNQPDLALRAVEVGLAFSPSGSALLHHKAVVLLSQNRDVDRVVPLLDRALEANPHDKSIWATKGDALKLQGRGTEAADAYLRAQMLDVASMQYVEKALKAAPNHSGALKAKLQLARSQGGDRPALEAAEALLAENPDDAELQLAHAELLASVGELDKALAAVAPLRALRPDDPRLTLLEGRLDLALGKTAEGIAAFRSAIAGPTKLDVVQLAEVAERVEAAGVDLPLAVEIRSKLREADPHNLANLQALQELARRSDDHALGMATSHLILESSPDNLEAMRSLAEFQFAAGLDDDGFATYARIQTAHPNATAELRKAVDAARAAGRSELMLGFARSLVAEDPDDLAAKADLAKALDTSGDRDGALALYTDLIARQPDSLPWVRENTRLLRELGRTDELPNAYEALFRLDPTRADVALERGNLMLGLALEKGEGSPERAEAARAALVSYERASLDASLEEPSLLGLARASRLVGDHDRAIRAYRQFLQNPDNARRADVQKELGHALRETGQLTAAEGAYQQALDLGLEDPDLLWGAVEVLSQLNEEAKALRFVDALLRTEPHNPLFLRRRGQLLVKAGRRTEGLESLKSAVEAAGSDPHVRFEVAEALRAQGAYADAVQYFRAALQLDPKSRPGRLALAETLVVAGRYNEAIPIVDELLTDDPNDVGAWKTRADAYRSLGRTGDLQYSLKAILLLDPNHAPALLEQFRLHHQAGEKGEAYDALHQLLAAEGADASDPALFLQAGDLAAELGRGEEANRAYERAAQLDPSLLGEIATRRARLRLAAGRPDLALEVLDQTLAASAPGERPVGTLLLRAEILMALERQAEAQAVYEQVRQKEPRSPSALAGIGRCLLDQGKHADAKSFLTQAIPQVPPNASLFLLLGEAESGLGDIPAAVVAVQKGAEALPKSGELWVRLGELSIARETWSEAANAYAHAIALEAANPEYLLRAAFVADKLGHPNEALALAERATQVAPANKYAWCSRGVALLETGRPEEARESFDRSLALDSDFVAAKEGRLSALQKTRDGQVEKFGREALLLEAKSRRAVTRNDLFVTLHVPFDLLEPVLQALSRNVKVDLDRLDAEEMKELEGASYRLVSAALEHRPEGLDRRGFTLADVAVLCPPSSTLPQIQRLFGYVRSVLEMDVRLENLKLAPDVEEMARRALLLPENQRTLFQLVRTLKVGLFKARLIKAVESAGGTVHAPLPSLDLGQYSPEFRTPAPGEPDDADFFPVAEGPNAAPAGPALGASTSAGPSPAFRASGPSPRAAPTGARCAGCGGMATVIHGCGAPVCMHCIAEFRTCPKCGQPVALPAARAAPAVAAPGHAAASGRAAHPESGTRPAHPTKDGSAHPKPPSAPAASSPKSAGADAPSKPPAKPAASTAKPAPAPPAVAEAAPPKPPRPPRERTDDEPRL
ncbi:MAG: tetratricopeptide repeat protein [Thermoplasmata archaeon]|nr:tetratricopeptide repeat protein [Thermoplasmata archaeon]